MRTEMHKVLTLKNFFSIITSNENSVKYCYKDASKILLGNIQTQWLQFIYSKTSQHFPIFLNKSNIFNKEKIAPYGYISQNIQQPNQPHIEYLLDNTIYKGTTELSLNLVIPAQDITQYFLQWQRYRKYWWSSITTTPSLFCTSDIKHGENSANVNIIANFDWGQKIVETISISPETNTKTSVADCKILLEDALVTLLLDGLYSSTREEYLRLHNKIAPYKISFALDNRDLKDYSTLKELIVLLMHKLKMKNISTWHPDFLLPLEVQLKENFKNGIPYTAIISESTLSDGIFQLMNSSTMLKEQIHVADFQSYAMLLCGKQ